MSEIKSSIGVLCKFLKLLYECNIRNENFRLAKFDSTEENTVSIFWHLLYNMCCYENKKMFNDENMVDFVKLNLAFLKYESLQFFSLPTDMSSGSRELLLAFSWLVASQKVLEKALKMRIMKCNISKEYVCPDLSDVCDKNEMIINIKDIRSASDCILWYIGKVHKNLKIIEDLSQQFCHITTKIHNETQNICGLPHLSAGDAKLIHDIYNSTNGYDHLKEGALLIEANNNWLKKEENYWNWMETVIQENEKQPRQVFNTEAKCKLLSFIKVLKRIIENTIHKRKLSNDSTASLSSQECHFFNGVPRFIMQGKSCENELEKLSVELSEHFEELMKIYNVQIGDAKSFLDDLSKKMKDVVVLNL